MDYVLIGAGGHAQVLLEVLRLNALDAMAMTDIDPSQTGKTIRGVPVIHEDELPVRFPASSTLLVNAVGGVADMAARKAVFTRWKHTGYTFATLVHPTAIVSTLAEFGEGVQLLAGSIVSTNARIAANTIINTGASVDHDCRIAPHCHIAPKAVLSGGVLVGEESLIGTGACVIQNIHIGAKTTIGAGSAVVHDIPDNVVAAGNPCRVVSTR